MITQQWCGYRSAVIGLSLAVLAFLVLPAPAVAQSEFIVQLALINLIAEQLIPQHARDSPTGLRSPGERGVTRVWSAFDERSRGSVKHQGGSCFALPEPPAILGVCGMTVDEL